MGWQQIADHLLVPVHLVKDGYRKACKRGMKARIPENRMHRIDSKAKELDPKSARMKFEREQQESNHRKKARRMAWKQTSKAERKEMIDNQRKEAKRNREIMAKQRRLKELRKQQCQAFNNRPMEMTAKSYVRAERSHGK